MRVPLHLSAGLLFVIALMGCQTTGSNYGEARYNVFFSPEDHISELIDQNSLKEADTVYRKERSFFVEKDENEKSDETTTSLGTFFSGAAAGEEEISVVDRLADAIEKTLTYKTDEAIRKLPLSEDWPVDVVEWKTVETALSFTKSLIREYDGYSVFKDANRKPEKYTVMKRRLSSLEATINASLDELFEAYSLVGSPVFFSHFPIKTELDDYLDSRQELWHSKLVGLSSIQLSVVYDDYKPWLNSQLQQYMGALYFDLKLSELSGGSQAAFKDIMATVAATRSSGMPIQEVDGANIALIEVTSRTLLEQGQIEFPTAIDVNVPFKFDRLELDDVFSNAVAKSADIVVLIDVAAARTNREITSYEQVGSEYQSGTKTTPNPQYNIAQNKVNNSQLALQSAAFNSASASAQWCQGLGCIGKAIGEIAAAVAEDEANEALQASMAALQSTPMTLEKPIYTPYEFRKAAITVTKETTVNYYVIDRIMNEYLQGTFDAMQDQSFEVAYGIHDQERNRSRHLSGLDSENDVLEFEGEGIEVPLSSILDEYLNQSTQARQLPSLTKIRKEILEDKNLALAEFKSQQFDVTPDKDDPRFDSVVVVYHPGGGLGTGFFVRDDVVLTNYHVIEGSQFVEMKLFSGQETFGKVIANDIRLDLALIKSQARGKPVTFYNDNSLPLGKTVDAIGHPTGLEFSIARGVVSSLREFESSYMPGGKKIHFIQTDTAINPGNSGGPLFLGNRVVGVNTQKLAATDLEGLGFSIHYSDVLKFLHENSIQAGS